MRAHSDIRVLDLDAAAPAPFGLTDSERAAIDAAASHYENPRAASIDALKIVQRSRGWVCDDAIDAIAQRLRIAASDVEGVATFYSLIFRAPVGRHVIKVCDSLACFLSGGERLRDALVAALGVEVGQTTPDDRFTLLPICCLGACDIAPAAMIDDDTLGPMSADRIGALLERYP